ncbi:MAG TPA: hypothetical protein VKV19_17755 [Ktedonobacteraceae bacterium]|nr:hypothetical protein [Ktedonobacteraceae bacterium]
MKGQENQPQKSIPSLIQQYLPRRSDRNGAAGLGFLVLATFFLSVVVFTFSPTSYAGLASAALGILCMLACIVFFVRYTLFLKREEREANE